MTVATETGTSAATAAWRAVPGHSPRAVNPAAAASARPVTTTTGARTRLRRTSASRAWTSGWPGGAADSVSRGGVDTEAPARHVPLARPGRLLEGGGLRLKRWRQPERAVGIRVGPAGHAVLPDALGQPHQLLELGLRDRRRGIGRREQVLASLLGARRSRAWRDREVPPAVARVVDRVGEAGVAVRPVALDDRHGVRVRRPPGPRSPRGLARGGAGAAGGQQRAGREHGAAA